ncbi:DUF5018 domain-containing protein [Sphingobacterium litopenaei]|uniref:DUF5018 domain-containing protein n=1 Tax=Sphingobacterium litopenaei TaxID=2763500 RepID=A0ABR7YAC8_9SPHI|nr:hypothetical protein [Sphingobacterium litopenaei]MBD1428259.1 hypothetical protein [Sphingobacterium litopenaei]
MKTILNINSFLFGLVMLFIASSCSKENELSREYQDVKIVGVKVDNQLYTPTYSEDQTVVTLPAGRDLSNVKVELLVVNGSVTDFENNKEYDVRKPINVSLEGLNGKNANTTLKIVSAPLLSTFIIEGLNIPASDIHSSSNSLIVQVPQGTNLKNLKVTMEFLNGTLLDFVSGQAKDYTNPTSFQVKGVDEATVYPFEFIITTEIVGPATIKSLTINGVTTDSVQISTGNVVTPFVPSLVDFSKSNVTIEAGFGNKIEAGFTGTNLNLLSGANKVKITGSDGVEREFTIAVPKLSLKPLFTKAYSAFGFPDNDLVGVAFSGNNIVVSNYSATAPTVVGPNYYNFSGQHVGTLDKADIKAVHSFRKIASDSKGKLLLVDLGINDATHVVYKWDNLTSKPVPYFSYSKTSLGFSYVPRSSGISISGSLDGDATITIGMAQKTDLLVWTVKNGVLNPTPQKLTLPITNLGYYWAAEPLPNGQPGYVVAAVGNTFSGIISTNNLLAENFKLSGISTSDCKVIAYEGRTYLAYTAYVSGRGAVLRICDITSGEVAGFSTPILDDLIPSTNPNGNLTMDVDMTVYNGKLYAVFSCTNIGMRLYQLN